MNDELPIVDPFPNTAKDEAVTSTNSFVLRLLVAKKPEDPIDPAVQLYHDVIAPSNKVGEVNLTVSIMTI